MIARPLIALPPEGIGSAGQFVRMNSAGTAREWGTGRDDACLRDGHIVQAVDPLLMGSAATGLSPISGTLYLTSAFLREGDLVTNLGFLTGTTAAVSPTHWWLAIYSSALALLASTADRTTDAIANNSVITKPLSTPYTSPSDQAVYLGLVVVAGTTPTVIRSNNVLAAATMLLTQYLAATSTTGITTDLPDPCGALTSINTKLAIFGT